MKAKPLAALTQRDQVGDKDFSERNDAATADALDTAADQERGEISGERTNYGTYREEDESDKEKRFATEYVGKRCESWLEDS